MKLLHPYFEDLISEKLCSNTSSRLQQQTHVTEANTLKNSGRLESICSVAKICTTTKIFNTTKGGCEKRLLKMTTDSTKNKIFNKNGSTPRCTGQRDCSSHKNCYVKTAFNRKSLLTSTFFANYLTNKSIFRLCMLHTLFNLLLLTGPVTDAYVLTQEGEDRTYIHKRLAGNERHEIQREILSILGLNRRPRLNGIRAIEKTSAPLYMLGLYSTVSSMFSQESRPGSTHPNGLNYQRSNEIEQPDISSRSRYQASTTNRGRSAGPFTLDPMMDPYSSGIAPSLNRYIADSGILTNEIGVFETLQENLNQPRSFGNSETYDGLTTNEVERRLLDYSDLVMSFTNTKPQRVLEENTVLSLDLRLILKRHRSYHFDIHQVSSYNQLTAAKFRLYKDRSDDSLGNETLRVNVYQTVLEQDGSAGIYLLGSRLVSTGQEGWLVYDVTSALREWLRDPQSNLGLKASIESISGDRLKPARTGMIGRKGDSTKQAFMVAFFSQDDEVREQVRRRLRRSPDVSHPEDRNGDDSMQNEDWLEDDDEEESYMINDTEQTGLEANIDDNINNTLYNEETPGNEIVPTGNTFHNEDDVRTTSRRRIRAPDREQRAKRKSRKKKRPKNGSKRKSTEEHCHREQLYVSFRDLGWEEWIIAPPGYAAYYCSGECGFPLNAQMNATNHAIVQSLVHLLHTGVKLPKPCCSPTRLGAIYVLYYNDNNNVVYHKYKDMVVKACGCH